jgi:xylulokinase
VVIGGGDGVCASAGAGVVSEGTAYNYIGSSSWIALATSEPIFDPTYRTFTYCHLVPDMYMPTGTTQAAGASYQWTRDTICRMEVHSSEILSIQPYELMDQQASQSKAGANGLLFLPYLMGERSPYWNPMAKGAFIGLTIRHTRADMIRAVLEGVALNLNNILQAFISQGAHVPAIRLIGGGAKARFWNQIMSNVYGIPVYRMKFLEEATSMGAALAGGIGVGLYSDFSLAESMNPIDEVIEPDLSIHKRYLELFPIFQKAYRVLEPVSEELHIIQSKE